MIDKYLKKEFKNQPLNYKITLTDVVRVDGTIQVFGDDINIRMTFDPIVQKMEILCLNSSHFLLESCNFLSAQCFDT
ncbi:DUF2140 family protein [Priestia megaterium]